MDTQELYSNLSDDQLKLLEKLETLKDFADIEAIKKEISILYLCSGNAEIYLYVKELVLLNRSDPDIHVSSYWKNYRVITDNYISILKKQFKIEIVTIESWNKTKELAYQYHKFII